MTSRGYILNLPIEILDLVYKNLPVMKDKINLAKAHCVLEKAFVFHAGDFLKNICTWQQSISDWSDILPMCGSAVTSLSGIGNDNAVIVIKLASMYCPNLEEILFFTSFSVSENFKKFNVVDTLLLMPKLKVLQFDFLNRKDGVRVGQLVNLTNLTLNNQSKYPIDIFKVCSPLKNIVTLEVRYAFFRMPKDYVDKELWPKIESLTIWCGYFPTPLPYLPTLRCFQINEINRRTKLAGVFGQSIFNYGKTLESLKLCPDSSYVIDADDLGIIMKLKALKKLNCHIKGDEGLNYLFQLENLEELNIRHSRVTTLGAIMLIIGCKKLHNFDLTACELVDSKIVKEAVVAVNSIHPMPDNPLVLRVGYDEFEGWYTEDGLYDWI